MIKLNGSILFFPIAFVLCSLTVSAYRYFTVPAITQANIEQVEGIILKVEDDAYEAAFYGAKDTLYYRGPAETSANVQAGKSIPLYKIRNRTDYLFDNKDKFVALNSSRNTSKWIAISSLIAFILLVGFLYITAPKRNGKTR